jgi:hypothetical protein
VGRLRARTMRRRRGGAAAEEVRLAAVDAATQAAGGESAERQWPYNQVARSSAAAASPRTQNAGLRPGITAALPRDTRMAMKRFRPKSDTLPTDLLTEVGAAELIHVTGGGPGGPIDPENPRNTDQRYGGDRHDGHPI